MNDEPSQPSTPPDEHLKLATELIGELRHLLAQEQATTTELRAQLVTGQKERASLTAELNALRSEHGATLDSLDRRSREVLEQKKEIEQLTGRIMLSEKRAEELQNASEKLQEQVKYATTHDLADAKAKAERFEKSYQTQQRAHAEAAQANAKLLSENRALREENATLKARVDALEANG